MFYALSLNKKKIYIYNRRYTYITLKIFLLTFHKREGNSRYTKFKKYNIKLYTKYGSNSMTERNVTELLKVLLSWGRLQVI